MPQPGQYAEPAWTDFPQRLHVITFTPHFRQAPAYLAVSPECALDHALNGSVSFFTELDNDGYPQGASLVHYTKRHIGMIQYTRYYPPKSTTYPIR